MAEFLYFCAIITLMDMKEHKYSWIVPALIIAANVVAIMVRWNSLPETLLAHFDPEGYASGTMPRSTLILYPIISAVICVIIYALGHWIFKRSKNNVNANRLRVLGLTFLASGVALTILSSSMVTLTQGTNPIFMFAEPVIMFFAIVAFVICMIKARKLQK